MENNRLIYIYGGKYCEKDKQITYQSDYMEAELYRCNNRDDIVYYCHSSRVCFMEQECKQIF